MAEPHSLFDRTLLIAPAGGVVAGTPCVVQDLPCIPDASAAAAATFTGIHKPMRKVTNYPKTTAEAWAAGQRLYAIAATGLSTTTVGTNKTLGYAAQAQLAGDTLGDVYLD